VKLELTAKIDPKKFAKFRKKFGDTSNQALLRVAVGAAREAAILTEVRGKSKKKQIDSIVTGARINIVAIPGRDFNKLASKRRPGFQFNRQWVRLRPNQLLRDADAVNEFIEKQRDGRGRVQKLKARDKAVCRKPDMTKTLVRRKKLAGVAKGSWIGAAKKASRLSRGPQRAKIGKNFLSWAQKHSDKGTARFRRAMLGRSEVRLISKAPATRRKAIFSQMAGREAIRRAWKNALAWYRRAARRIDKER